MRLTASPGPPGFDGRGTPELDPVAGAEVITDAATGVVLVGVNTDAATGVVLAGDKMQTVVVGEAIIAPIVVVRLAQSVRSPQM